MSTPPATTLNPKQRKFADLFLGGMDAGPAYTAAGYSRNGAKESACRLLKTPAVAAYIEEARRILSEHSRIKQWEVLQVLSDIITTPCGEVDETSPLCQKLTRDEVGEETVRIKIEMPCKLGAIDRMAKMLGWYAPQQVQVSTSSELEALIASIRKGNNS